ncbi:MAG: mechanosensitive ion channel [Planctomycetales bacterium]|nr:mechanosensitive ion channel [Planctomycetales bacterium]
MDETTASIAANNSAGAPSPVISHTLESFSDLMNGRLSVGTSGLILKVIVPAAVALLLLIVTYFVARLVARWVAAVVCNHVDQTLGQFAGRLTFYSLMIMVGLTVLQTANVDVTGFAAVIAAAGFAIGLAFQGTLGNFASGVLLLVFRPFKVGDMINAAGVMGKVNEIDLFTTTLDTTDNRRLIIPNSSIAGATIENISYHKHRRVDVPIGVAYAASLDETRRVLTLCAESLGDKLITGEGRGYQILLVNLGAHSVEWMVRAWVATPNFFAVKEALTTQIKQQFDLNGLQIPFPQMQLHVTDNSHGTVSTANPNVPIQETLQATLLPTPKLSSLAEQQSERAPRVRPRARGERV